MVPYPIMHPGECCEPQRALWEGWWWMCVLGLAESRVTSLICSGHFLTCSPLCAVHCRKVVFRFCPSWPTPMESQVLVSIYIVYTQHPFAGMRNVPALPVTHTYTQSFSLPYFFLLPLSHTHTHMHTHKGLQCSKSYIRETVFYQRYVCAAIFRC